MATARWEHEANVLGGVLAAGFGGSEVSNPYRAGKPPEAIPPEVKAHENKIAWKLFDQFMVDFAAQQSRPGG